MPSVLTRPRTGARTGIVLLVVGLLAVVVQPLAHASPRTAVEVRAETLMFEQHQRARTSPRDFTSKSGTAAPAFEGWADLRTVARSWSDVQSSGGCPGANRMCHNTTANGGVGFQNQICCFSRAGENVGYTVFHVAGSSPSDSELRGAVRRLMTRYMDSDAHRRNILDPGYRHFGTSVSLVRVGTSTWSLHSTTVFRQHDGTTIDSQRVGSTSTASSATSSDGVCPTTPVLRFNDLDRRGTVGRAAGCVADLGITQGMPDGSYRPAGHVTRAQMASFLLRTLDAMRRPAPAAGSKRFRDVSGAHADAIHRLHAAGIVTGRSDGTFRPGATVTRAQMASFIARTYEYAARQPLPAGSSPFTDIRGSVHEQNIDRLTAARIATGTGTRTYSPDERVTRGQMALFLTRLLERYAAR